MAIEELREENRELRRLLEDLALRVARLEEMGRPGPEPDPLATGTMLFRESMKVKARATGRRN